MDDYKNGIEKAKEIYRSIHPGGCRIISKGDSCVCFLCQCDHAVDRHLTQQYSGLAKLVEKAQVKTGEQLVINNLKKLGF